MQGQRTDRLYYNRILSYIKRFQPISSEHLHVYLNNRCGIISNSSRSKLLKKLVDQKYLIRTGKHKAYMFSLIPGAQSQL
jgi:hypothetical protein